MSSSRDSLELWESGAEVVNIFSPFQTHSDSFTLYIPPYLLCPATQRTKKATKQLEKRKTEILPIGGFTCLDTVCTWLVSGGFTSVDFEKRVSVMIFDCGQNSVSSQVGLPVIVWLPGS